MNTRHTSLRLLLAVLLPALFIAAGCDSNDAVEGYEPVSTATMEQSEFRIDCFMEDGEPGPVFEATGAINDEGTVSGESLPWSLNGDGPLDWSGVRTFHGQAGNLTLFIEAQADNHGSNLARGDFVLVSASEEYSDLQAEGDFELLIEQGAIAEVFEGVLTRTR
jgi:hypothetical protein